MANITRNSFVDGTNKTRSGWGNNADYVTWDETDPTTWDDSYPHDWDWANSSIGFPDGTNKTRNSKP